MTTLPEMILTRTSARKFSAAERSCRDEVVRALDKLPRALPTIEAVRLAVEAASSHMHGRRDLARERQKIVATHADLQERELIKRAKLTAALAQALRERGVAEPAASLGADLGMAVFYVGFARWLDDPAGREFVEIVHEVFEQMKTVASGA